MENAIKLSDGSVVSFRPHYTHKAEREYNAALMEGVTFKTEIATDKDGTPLIDEETGNIKEVHKPEGMKASNATKANEALIRCLIASVKDAAGRDLPFSSDWLDNIAEPDYKLIEEKVTAMKAEVDAKKKEDKAGQSEAKK